VHFIGVDLAWGDNRPTGVAVLDDDGRLLHVGAEQSDQDIVAALKPYVQQACLAGIDAPLIVTNPTGNRPAEAALNRDFARFQAGAHPANTGKPEFRPEPRGARISAALGLDLRPGNRRKRRAVEVYPHAATIALFRLGRTLKYKNKPGRTFETLRAELLTLVRLVEGLADADPPLRLGAGWPDLVAAVRAAERKSQLRVVEDQVDAVLCAYVALFATRRPQDSTSYGDGDTGFIVTPTLPAGHLPGPRDAAEPVADDPVEDDPVQRAVSAYAAQQPELRVAGQDWIDLVKGILDEAGINYLTVTGRTKSVPSFAAKAARRVDGEPAYADPLAGITDQIGVRVITYVLGDVAAVAELLHDQVDVRDDRDMGQETASEGRFGYSSRHLVVALDAAREQDPGLARLRGRVAAVQIRTVLQHAWAEFEHDIRYKGAVPDEHAREFDRRFTLAAGLLELADREFSTIRDRLSGGSPAGTGEPDDDPRIDPRELAAFLAGQYEGAGWSRTDHYDWISGLLLELGITSLNELAEVLRPVNALDLPARMAYRYPPGAVRRLDDGLLAAFGEQYIGLPGNAHRVEQLRTRLDRLLAEPSG
jgi:predicted RNase H-like nuclease/ppGpp synthetase/RelA/SpoT-type nucleotidyltranferase